MRLGPERVVGLKGGAAVAGPVVRSHGGGAFRGGRPLETWVWGVVSVIESVTV